MGNFFESYIDYYTSKSEPNGPKNKTDEIDMDMHSVQSTTQSDKIILRSGQLGKLSAIPQMISQPAIMISQPE